MNLGIIDYFILNFDLILHFLVFYKYLLNNLKVISLIFYLNYLIDHLLNLIFKISFRSKCLKFHNINFIRNKND